MLDEYTGLRGMHDENDTNTQVLYLKNAVATFSSFAAAPETYEFEKRLPALQENGQFWCKARLKEGILMNILLTAFRGTSSEQLIRQFDARYDRLVLHNDKVRSVQQLIHALELKEYCFVLSFGQKPVIKDKVYMECCGQVEGTAYQTSFDVNRLAEVIAANGIPVKISHNAGTSFCNHLYAHGLQYLAQSPGSPKMVFLHIPFQKNLIDFYAFSEKLQSAVECFFADGQ